MKYTQLGYAMVALLLLLTNSPNGVCQEADAVDMDVETQQLIERAERVQEQYPWLVQQDRGLVLLAVNIPREEFLQGVTAATDLVFDGTDELPELITLQGVFPNIEAALKNLSVLDPGLRQSLDLKAKKGRFSHLEDTTAGLSDEGLVRKYKRQKLANASAPDRGGAFMVGSLVIDGTLIPPPVQVEVIPNRDLGEVQVTVNQNIIERLKYTDPYVLDQELFQANTPAKFKKAVESKADRIWQQVCQIPFSGTGERLLMTVTQLSAIHGIAYAKADGEDIQIETLEGKKFTWSPKPVKNAPLTEPEAFQKAYDLQSQLFSALGSGGMAFCSIQFGTHVIPDGFYFMNDLRKIISEEGVAVPDKARKIRERWPEHADWILEFYYTSLMDEAAQAPANPLLNSPYVIPFPTPVMPEMPNIPNMPAGGQGGPKTPEEILKEFIEKQR